MLSAITGASSAMYYYPTARYAKASGPTPVVEPVDPVTPVSENTNAGQMEKWYRSGQQDRIEFDKNGRIVDPAKKDEQNDSGECQTCENRRYQDGSDDPGVSFKVPTKMSPEQAQSAVRSHEMEHVTREQASAKREGREVVSQSVTYHSGICPECGEVYVAGGTTRTTTRSAQEQTADKYKESMENTMPDSKKDAGSRLDMVA